MNLSFEQLNKHLSGKLSSVYAVSGDEYLLVQEALDAIKNEAHKQGFLERQIFNVERGFNWHSLLDSIAARSLFSSKKILELRLPTGKPGTEGAQIISNYLAKKSNDILLIMVLPKLEAAVKNSKWCKALLNDENCQFVTIWPVPLAQFPRWLNERSKKMGMQIASDAIDLIAAKTEGNLLAAQQELTKLQLLVPNKEIDLACAQAALSDSSRYNIFNLTDAVLAGDLQHSLHILAGLKGESVEPTIILWALVRELRILISLCAANSLDAALNELKPRPNPTRRNMLANAVRRFDLASWHNLLALSSKIDAQIKGQLSGNVWQSLQILSLALAGKSLNLSPF